MIAFRIKYRTEGGGMAIAYLYAVSSADALRQALNQLDAPGYMSITPMQEVVA